jgi:hypothetical protein
VRRWLDALQAVAEQVRHARIQIGDAHLGPQLLRAAARIRTPSLGPKEEPS